jgi:hypothetical protein
MWTSHGLTISLADFLFLVIINTGFHLGVRRAKPHRINALGTLILSVSPDSAINVEPAERNTPRY